MTNQNPSEPGAEQGSRGGNETFKNSPSSEAAKWIALLSSGDEEERAVGGAALYLAGHSLFREATKLWMKDPEFRALMCAPQIHGAKNTSLPPAFIAGIAVEPVTFERIRAAHGAPRLADVPPDQDAQEFELEIGAGYFDILTTREPGGAGAIAKFLQKFGEGIQQIEVYVRDVERATQILRDRFGTEPIYPKTRGGADGTLVNFFLVAAAEGRKVLVELVEAPASSGH